MKPSCHLRSLGLFTVKQGCRPQITVKPLQKQVHVIVSAYIIFVSSFLSTPLFGVYYRVYAEDGAIRSTKPATADDPFLGCVKAKSIPPPHTVASIKRCIAGFEEIGDNTLTSLFGTLSSKSPMDSADKAAILNRNGLGYMPKEPIVLVAKLSESQWEKLDSDGRSKHVNILGLGVSSPELTSTSSALDKEVSSPETRLSTSILSITLL